MSLCPVPGTGRDGTLFPGDTRGHGTLFGFWGRDGTGRDTFSGGHSGTRDTFRFSGRDTGTLFPKGTCPFGTLIKIISQFTLRSLLSVYLEALSL